MDKAVQSDWCFSKRASDDSVSARSSASTSGLEKFGIVSKKKGKKSAESVEIREATLNYLVQDMLPFWIVKKEGFKTFVDTLRPGSALPTRKTLVSKLEVCGTNSYFF